MAQPLRLLTCPNLSLHRKSLPSPSSITIQRQPLVAHSSHSQSSESDFTPPLLPLPVHRAPPTLRKHRQSRSRRNLRVRVSPRCRPHDRVTGTATPTPRGTHALRTVQRKRPRSTPIRTGPTPQAAPVGVITITTIITMAVSLARIAQILDKDALQILSCSFSLASPVLFSSPSASGCLLSD